MEAVEFGEYLKDLRKKKKMTIRQLDTYSGVSNSYISQLERGLRGIPSPDILLKLSKPLGVDYEQLMVRAGYVQIENKDSMYPLTENQYEMIVRDTEKEFNIDLHDDPDVQAAFRDLVRSIARIKQKH